MPLPRPPALSTHRYRGAYTPSRSPPFAAGRPRHPYSLPRKLNTIVERPRNSAGPKNKNSAGEHPAHSTRFRLLPPYRRRNIPPQSTTPGSPTSSARSPQTSTSTLPQHESPPCAPCAEHAPLTLNTSFSSPFDVPPLRGREEQYDAMHAKDREGFRHTPALYAVWNAKPWLLHCRSRRRACGGTGI